MHKKEERERERERWVSEGKRVKEVERYKYRERKSSAAYRRYDYNATLRRGST